VVNIQRLECYNTDDAFMFASTLLCFIKWTTFWV